MRLLVSVILILSACLLAAPVVASPEKVKLRDGAVCLRNAAPAENGETHRCFFQPGMFGRRDFTAANGRAFYVFSELGKECDEIEILADEDYVTGDGQNVRRVGALCHR
jgi:hypothetical protein